MIAFNGNLDGPKEASALRDLGDSLRARRIERGETQAEAARRVGMSIPTYQKLEQGSPSASMGSWARVLSDHKALGALSSLLPVSLFSAGMERRRSSRK